MILDWVKIIGIVGGLVGLLFSVRGMGRHFGWHPEWQRKCMHVALGTTALSFPWLFGAAWQVWAVCGLGAGVMVAVRTVPKLRRTVGCSLHNVGRASFGELLFALAIGLLFALADGELLPYLLPLAILTLADSSAALVGRRWGRHRFPVLAGQKSWEGVLTFGGVTTLLTSSALSYFTPLPWPTILLLTLLITLLCTLTEAVAWHGLDNLLVPLTGYLALVAFGDLASGLLVLQLLGLAFVSIVLCCLPASLATHTRLMGILVGFCLWSGGPLLWLPLLLVLLLTHTVVEKHFGGQLLAPFEDMPVHYWLALAGA